VSTAANTQPQLTSDGANSRLPVHRRKADLVTDFLREQIVSGAMVPGQRITLGELAAKTGMSQMPVREAMLRLQSEGLLVDEPHKGMSVAPVSRRDAAELFEVRVELEGLAADRASRNADGALEAELSAVNDRFAAAERANDFSAMGELNWAFHRRILVAADSSQLARLLEDVWTRSFRYRVGYRLIPGHAKLTVIEHREIIRAIAARDAEGARAAARAHVSRGGSSFEAVLAAQEAEG